MTQYSGRMPDMSRDERLAGQTVYTNGMNVTYNDQGYAVSAINPHHSRYDGTTRSVTAQPKEDALAGKPWEAPDTSALVDWGDGTGMGGGSDARWSRANEDYASAYDGAGAGYPSAYDAVQSAYAAQKAENEAAVRRAVDDLTEQKAAANRSYDDYARQAYRDRMAARRDVEQYLGARGVTGGAAESTITGLNTSYADELRRIEQSRRETVGGIDRAIADARFTGDLNNAKTAAQAAKERSELYAQEQRERKVEQERQAQYEREAQTRREQYERADAQDRRSWARKLAEQMLTQGVLPDNDTLAAAGITPAQAQALLTQIEEPGYVPTFTTAQVMDAYNRALKTGRRLPGNMLRDYYFYVYGDPDYSGR